MSDSTKIRILVYDVFRSVCLLYVCSVSSRQGVSDVNVRRFGASELLPTLVVQLERERFGECCFHRCALCTIGRNLGV